MIDKYFVYGFKDFDITNYWDTIVRKLERCNTLLKSEKDFILAECLKFKETGLKRYKEIEDEYSKKFEDKFNGAFNEFGKSFKQPQISKTIYKQFYRTLALKFHPDKGGTAEEMTALNQLKELWEI